MVLGAGSREKLPCSKLTINSFYMWQTGHIVSAKSHSFNIVVAMHEFSRHWITFPAFSRVL
jgi:hypothetical protein